MKKLIITLSILIWFILIFYYENKNLIMSNNLNNTAITNYNTWSYQDSINLFSWALALNNDFKITYNLGNSLFKTDNEAINIEDKIKLYNEVLEIYSWSLAVKYNQDTQDNYEFVQYKLNQLLNPEEKYQEEENNNENSDESENTESNTEEWESENSENDTNNSDGENNQSWDESSKSKEWEKNKWSEKSESESNQSEDTKDKSEQLEWQNESSQWSGSEQWNNLSQEALEQIEEYAENLKKSEFYNQKYFNKKEPEQNQDIDWFFRDPFFDDSFSRWWEKDW
jgi:hypothetical protein